LYILHAPCCLSLTVHGFQELILDLTFVLTFDFTWLGLT
jgi:hypothetical protein